MLEKRKGKKRLRELSALEACLKAICISLGRRTRLLHLFTTSQRQLPPSPRYAGTARRSVATGRQRHNQQHELGGGVSLPTAVFLIKPDRLPGSGWWQAPQERQSKGKFLVGFLTPRRQLWTQSMDYSIRWVFPWITAYKEYCSSYWKSWNRKAT